MKAKIKQHDVSDCGAACLASIAACYKLQIPLGRIRQYACTDQKGTSVLGMIAAAEKLGFTAKGVKGPYECLFNIPRPVIAHISLPNGLQHYLVIYKIGKKHVTVMDPADGKMHRLTHPVFRAQWTGVLIILLPGEDFVPGKKSTSVVKRFWFLIRPHKMVMLQAIAGAVVYTLTGLSVSIYIQKIVDYVLTGRDTGLLNLMSVIMIFLLSLQLFTGTLKTIFSLKTGLHIDARLILGYYKHLLRLPQQFFDTMRVGEIISRINDAVKIRVFINDAALNIVVDLLILIFSFSLMFIYYWKLALILLAIIPFYLVIYGTVNFLNKSVQRKMMENSAHLESQLVESLNAISTIRCFGLEQHAGAKTETRFIALLRSVYSSGMNSLYAGSATSFITQLFTVILLWTGSYFVIGNELTPGELLSFYALVGYFTGPAGNLIGMNRLMQDALIAADRLFEIMDLEREEAEQKAELTKDMTGDICFREVCFRYGSRKSVFDNLSLRISGGSVTAIVGESGSGKSTLLALLQNIYLPEKGRILIGGHDTRYFSLASLRAVVGAVPQQAAIFAGNILENIAVGDHSPDFKKIQQICEQLGMNDFIDKIPGGFYGSIGEQGCSLSGGQKQRLAIARALYREPEILVLDEATAALDVLAEQLVQSTIALQRRKGKTIIIISHRLSTIRDADKIMVLDKGKVAEEGTHTMLLQNRQLYHRLWQRQYGDPVNG